jgi:hypothetical protein
MAREVIKYALRKLVKSGVLTAKILMKKKLIKLGGTLLQTKNYLFQTLKTKINNFKKGKLL